MSKIDFHVCADSAKELQETLRALLPQTAGRPEAPAAEQPPSLEDLIARLQAALGDGYRVVVMSDAEYEQWGAQRSAPAAEAPAAEAPAQDDTPAAVPAAKALADEHGVDLSQITGTGVNGRILKSDVQGYLDSQIEQGSEPEAPAEDRAALVDVDDTMADADKMARAKMVWAHIYGASDEGAERTRAMLSQMGVRKFNELPESKADELLTLADEALGHLGLTAPAA